MKFISLPNGTIINLEHIAYISTDGREEGKPDGFRKTYVDGAIIIHFAVPRSINLPKSEWMEPHMKLKCNGKNAESFLEQLSKLGVDIESLSKARKVDRKELLKDYKPNHLG